MHGINGREPISSKICISANVQENVILHYKTFYFDKACAETWNFSLPKKLDLRKTKLFHNRPSSFCSRYPNICDRTKKMDYSRKLYPLGITSEIGTTPSMPELWCYRAHSPITCIHGMLSGVVRQKLLTNCMLKVHCLIAYSYWGEGLVCIIDRPTYMHFKLG
jgi:hypothetical protein